MKVFLGILYGIIGLVVVLYITWIVAGNNFVLFKFFAPKEEQVRREVFEQSKAYNQGMVQELRAMQLEYVRATPEQKQALASIILHRFADYDDSKLPADLHQFMSQLKSESIK